MPRFCLHPLQAACPAFTSGKFVFEGREPKEGAGAEAESGLKPFGQGIVESWVPRVWSRRGYQTLGGHVSLASGDSLPVRRGTAGGGAEHSPLECVAWAQDPV